MLASEQTDSVLVLEEKVTKLSLSLMKPQRIESSWNPSLDVKGGGQSNMTYTKTTSEQKANEGQPILRQHDKNALVP